ncbi:MAG: hypothetical protein ACMXYB_01325 [Candidatus Woesearchaeota archaeon]
MNKIFCNYRKISKYFKSKIAFSEAIVVLVLFSSLTIIGVIMFSNYQNSVLVTQEQLSSNYITSIESRNQNFEILEISKAQSNLTLRIRNIGSTQFLVNEFSFFINSNFIKSSNIEFLDSNLSPIKYKLITPFEDFEVQIIFDNFSNSNNLLIVHNSGAEKQIIF